MYVCMYVCMCMYVYAYLKNKSHVLNLPCILVARVASNVPKGCIRYHHTGQWLPNTHDCKMGGGNAERLLIISDMFA